MLNTRQLFLEHLAQTSMSPMMLDAERAEGIYIYDTSGKAYIDLIAGISVSNLGHCHPKVVEAVKQQADKHFHLMVYGEFIQNPQVELATLLCEQLDSKLNSVYLVNSGSEATEGALKIAKKYTGRDHIISFKNAYHGSTLGALSVIGDEKLKEGYGSLLPNVSTLEFNNFDHLSQINEQTACVIIEPVQGEAGIIVPEDGFLKAVRERCSEKGTMLILDEIQTGMGRTGKLFAHQHYDIVPDILTLAKAFGGGMPIGAFISSNEIMSSISDNPPLGHISTFGGHPICCAAAIANLKELLESDLISQVEIKEALFKDLLKHPSIRNVRSKGLLMAVEFEDASLNLKLIEACIKDGLITDWFLFADNCLRIAPPLIITEEQIKDACEIILRNLDTIK